MTEPTVATIGQALNATPEQLQQQVANVTTDILNDLVSGTNPLKSKTILFNLFLEVVGIAGTVYTLYSGGNMTQVAPFLVSIGMGAVNQILRCMTTGPILSTGMKSILGALTTTTVSK